ncbi:MAG: response regulator, partial [Lachnospiraceae bacterium]|nr:response regulator [Lachnospiraceae bacterium]
MQIAICDDSAKDTKLMREYICRYCSENDIAYEISEAASGEALIKLSNIADYDCICMDIYMD